MPTSIPHPAQVPLPGNDSLSVHSFPTVASCRTRTHYDPNPHGLNTRPTL